MTTPKRGYGVTVQVIAAILGFWMVGAASAYGQVGASQLTVSVAPERVSASVGEEVEVTITLVNKAAEPTQELAIHLDITDPQGSGSVDPEDWTTRLTRTIPAITPDTPVTMSWTFTPIQPGDFVLYAVALDASVSVEPGRLAVSNGVPVRVDEQGTFNPQGILPLAIAMPTMIGVVLLWRLRRLRPK